MTVQSSQEKRRERNRRYRERAKAKKATPAPVVDAGIVGKVSETAVARSRRKPGRNAVMAPSIFRPYKPAPRVVPATMAMDEAFTGQMEWAEAALSEADYGGMGFLGYPLLAELAQRPEYRRISEIIAMEMTRKWVTIQSSGDEDKSDKIAAINAAMERLKVRDVFREAAEQDGFFGRGHIYIDLGTTEDPNELKTPIGDGRNDASKAKVQKASLKRLCSVEPVWCYPSHYNSSDPLRPDWFRPTGWFVQGKEVHASRLLTIVGREVSDLLKPAYSFGGLPLSQMAKPYVDNWLRTRQSVADLISSFSAFVLATNLADKLGMDGSDLFKRAELFNNLRDNRGLMIIDKERETFQNVSASLSTLDNLQAQTQEHMASVSGIPLVKLLGIQPAGLNASSEGELECFYTWVGALQEKMFRDPLTRILGFIQLSELGEIDPDLHFRFEPLWELSEKETAEVRKINAETGKVLIDAKVISPAEERARIAGDGDSIYDTLDVDVVPSEPISAVEKATIAAGLTAAIVQAEGAGVVSTPTALKELQKLGAGTGVWTTISEEEIAEAAIEPPPVPEEGLPGITAPPEAS